MGSVDLGLDSTLFGGVSGKRISCSEGLLDWDAVVTIDMVSVVVVVSSTVTVLVAIMAGGSVALTSVGRSVASSGESAESSKGK